LIAALSFGKKVILPRPKIAFLPASFGSKVARKSTCGALEV